MGQRKSSVKKLPLQRKRVCVVTVVLVIYIHHSSVIVASPAALPEPLFSFRRLFVKFDIEKQLGEKRFYGFHYLPNVTAHIFSIPDVVFFCRIYTFQLTI